LSDTAQKLPVTADLAQIFEPIREDLERVEQEFDRRIQSRVALIPEMGKYIQKSGGKRVRPAVLLMAARLAGYTGDKAVLNASVVEFIHTATLVHDDIIDGADVRRGRLAVHSRWGNDITVLLGDYLYIKSMAMALTQDSLDIVRLLCDVTLRMIEGELYQLTKTGDVDITEEEHFEIIRRKTAHLFGGCAQIGGVLGRVSTEQEHALREFGFNLGVAFQVVDDLLDYTADESAPRQARSAADLREGKVTPRSSILLAARRRRRRVASFAASSPTRRDQGQWRDMSACCASRRTRLAYQKATSTPPRQVVARRFPPSREREAQGARRLRPLTGPVGGVASVRSADHGSRSATRRAVARGYPPARDLYYQHSAPEISDA
jgi:octaprenyl-diphosphate synthase